MICGSFGFAAYLSYFLKQFIWPEGKLPFAVAFMGCVIAGVPVFFRKKLEKLISEKIFFVLENIFAYGMLFYTVTFLALSAFIFSAPAMECQTEELSEKTVFVVYGAGLQGEEPGSILRKRLDKTAECMEKLPDAKCILTGSQGADEICTEAYAMKKYLLKKGISEDRMILEEEAHNTVENVQNSFIIIENELPEYTAVSISNSFHIPRIGYICSKLGKESKFILAKDPGAYTLYTVLVREYMSYAKLLILGSDG